jgi:hypothetical protein
MQSRARRRGPRTTGPTLAGLVAAVPVAILAIVLISLHTTISESARFIAFSLVGVALPGLALWRLIGNYRHNLVEDCAAGFAVGTAAQVIVYLASASVGLQRWSWGWAPIVLVVALLDKDARARVWRRVEEPLRPMQAWLLSAACAVVLFVVYRTGPAQFVPAYTDPARSYPDLAFQQAVAASAKYDVPIKTLWIGGEPLHYHTFFHQSTAATAWATRIDLTPLIHSLTWLPFLLAGCGLVFALTTRFLVRSAAGYTWAGPLAVLLTGLGGTLQVLPDLPIAGISAASSAYLSPTQNLGVLLALGLCLVVVDLLRSPPSQSRSVRSRWVLLIILTLVASGAKSTIVPMAGCGFALLAVILLGRGRSARIPILGGILCVAVFLGALFTIFGGESWGTEIKPFETFAQLSPYSALRHGPGVDRAAQLVSAAASLLAWTLAASGVFFLGRKWRDPGSIFLAGFAVAGLLASMMTAQSGQSQIYFLRMAFPVIAVLACVGLANLVGRLGDQRGPILVAGAGMLGLAALAAARIGADDLRGVKGPWLWAAGALLVATALATAAWKLASRQGGVLTVLLATAVSATMVGAVLVPVQALFSHKAADLTFAQPAAGGATAAEAGAARWLKRNSKPGDLVATNAHCAIKREDVCDSRHFWIAALTERPVLVEGWSYSNKANKISMATGVNPSLLPYWNEEVLAVNDTAFTSPSPAVIERLRKSGVRWLYADRRAGPVSPNLKQYVRLRHATLDATVYEIR